MNIAECTRSFWQYIRQSTMAVEDITEGVYVLGDGHVMPAKLIGLDPGKSYVLIIQGRGALTPSPERIDRMVREWYDELSVKVKFIYMDTPIEIRGEG